MIARIIKLYVSLMPVILAGALNMWFCKQPIADRWKRSIDGGRLAWDGRPFFGINKTWKGFFGMMMSGAIMQVLWSIIMKIWPALQTYNFFAPVWTDNLINSAVLGLLLGLTYALWELPNSFLKRRFAIVPGKLGRGPERHFFFVLDQIDSLLGCAWLTYQLTTATWLDCLGIVFLGAFTHVAVNQVLYRCGLRNNPV
ncbi:CDP-archaeol synthase [Vaginisenegalia massiliensis]|uniref:CDP-archaeol synthase n=1 Tax=Vaginisenegalia massiliensis TaxID=2058294 RepID=UPI000F52BE58|nr:CDP-archaeol synthase [Vaginisenegalia massiliensis]